MAKDPAFLFYPGDWLGGTMYLTHLEKGCYIDLLMLQFNKGKFTLAQAKHMLSGSFDLAWANISDKFIQQDGLYWNERLQEEKEKRSKFSESRRNNAKSPKLNNKKTEAYAKHMVNHMEDVNVNVDCKLKREKKIKKGEPIYRKFKHLTLYQHEFDKLFMNYTKEEIDETLDAIENYKENTKYNSLYLTAGKWLKKDADQKSKEKEGKMGKAEQLLKANLSVKEMLRQKREQEELWEINH